MSEKLRVGIAGFGVVGKRRRQYIDLHPSMATVAVADRSFAGNGTFPDGVRFYSSFEELISHETLDVLFVCLTNDVAPAATIAGLEKGLHVFCEKPPARTVAELAEVVAVERRHPALKLKYGFNHRYHDSVRDALRIIRSGELGSVLNLRGVYGKSAIITFNQSDWRTRRDLSGGGVLLDQGIHMVDMMRLFAGEFEEIHSFMSNSFWQYDVEDNAYALMRTSAGVVAMLHSSATQWRHRFHLEIALQRGTIVLSGILSGSKSYGAETITVAYPRPEDAGDPREVTTRYNEDNSWRDEIDEFAESVLNDRPILNGSSVEALRTMELVYRIYCADPAWQARYELEHTIPGGIV